MFPTLIAVAVNPIVSTQNMAIIVQLALVYLQAALVIWIIGRIALILVVQITDVYENNRAQTT